MTLADFFLAINSAGVRLANVGGQLQLRGQAQAITPELREGAAEHKAAILAILPSLPATTQPTAEPPEPWDQAVAELPGPWEQAAADALIADIQARRRQLWGEAAWPANPAAHRRLGEWMDRMDDAWLVRDLPGLRRLAAEFPAGPGPAITRAEEEAVLRVIERDQGLPSGSLMFYPVVITGKNRETQDLETSRAAVQGSPEVNLPFPDAG
jgi:hypothetical protein